MKTQNIQNKDSKPLEHGFASLSCNSVLSSAKPPRITLTKSQYETYIASKTDVSSKKGKTIHQQTKLSRVVEFVLKDVCRRSNGGCVGVGINQLQYRKSKLPCGSPINSTTLSNAIKNLVQHGFFVKVGDYKRFNNANIYNIGELIVELLDPIKLKQHNKTVQDIKKNQKYIDFGYDLQATKICPCCREEKRITHFDLDEPSTLLLPVCRNCSYMKHQKNQKPQGWDSAWSSFYMEKNQTNDVIVTPEQVQIINNNNFERVASELLARL